MRVDNSMNYLLSFLLFLFYTEFTRGERCCGIPIGLFSNVKNGLSGVIFPVDDTKILISDFSYDGPEEDVVFWVSKTPTPSPDGIAIFPIHRLHDADNINGPIANVTATLILPNTMTLQDIRSIAVWSTKDKESYGDVQVSAELEMPHPKILIPFTTSATSQLHTGNVEILDASTIKINEFTYDGKDGTENFMVRKSNSNEEIIIANEEGSYEPLAVYKSQTVVLKLQTSEGFLTVCDIDWLSVKPMNYSGSNNRILIPNDLNVPVSCINTRINNIIQVENTTINIYNESEVTSANKEPVVNEVETTETSSEGIATSTDSITSSIEGITASGESIATSDKGLTTFDEAIMMTTMQYPFNNRISRIGHRNYDNNDNSSFNDQFSENIDWKIKPVLIGNLTNLSHNVSGLVQILDGYSIRIFNFTYDGNPPGANFMIGKGLYPSSSGTIIADDLGAFGILGPYKSNVELILMAENNLKLSICDIDWISVYSIEKQTSYGHVFVPRNLSMCSVSKFNYKETKNPTSPLRNIIGSIVSLGHNVSSGEVEVIDEHTIKIPFFTYDGKGISTVFWVGEGDKPSRNGTQVADEMASFQSLKAYNGETIQLSLQGTKTNYSICNLDWLSVFSTQYNTNYGNIMIPKNLQICSKQPKIIGHPQPFKRGQPNSINDAEPCCGVLDLLNTITPDHGVSTAVFALNKTTILLKGFNFDGSVIDAYFWIDKALKLTPNGVRMLLDPDNIQPIEKVTEVDLLVNLPSGTQLKEFQSFGIWSESENKSLGEVSIPKNFRAPGPNIIGPFSSLLHGVHSAKLIIMDATTIKMPKLFYDGNGPPAFFFVGQGQKPSLRGVKISDENGSFQRLKLYHGQTITLKLSSQSGLLTICDLDWISIYNPIHQLNYGHVMIPKNLHIPSSCPLAEIPNSDDDFYDMEYGQNLDELGPVARIKNDFQDLLTDESLDQNIDTSRQNSRRGETTHNLENDKIKYETPHIIKSLKKTTTPSSVQTAPTVYQTKEPSDDVNSLVNERTNKQLHDDDDIRQSYEIPPLPNCLLLAENFELRWKADQQNVTIELTSKIGDFDYMAFGISGLTYKNQMIGGDVTITAYNDKYGGYAEDYVMNARVACNQGFGVCPAIQYPYGKSYSYLLSSKRVDGITSVRFTRQLYTGSMLHKDYHNNKKTTVIWAIGPFDGRGYPAKHSIHSTDVLKLNLTQEPQNLCKGLLKEQQNVQTLSDIKELSNSSMPTITLNTALGVTDNIFTDLPPEESVSTSAPVTTTTAVSPDTTTTIVTSTVSIVTTQSVSTDSPIHANITTNHWIIPNITGDNTKTFNAQIGQAGQEKGYKGITGKPSWGIVWYINQKLIPELILQRGTTYKFIIEGGNNNQLLSKYHPLYITDNSEGGFVQKKSEESKNEKIFAGGPETVGRLCEWEQNSTDITPDSFDTFDEYFAHLTIKCENGQPGSFEWMPDKNTPDLVYYQCYNHRNLGWKIHVVNSF